MVEQKLVEYIKKQLSQNKSENQIIEELKAVGWDYTDIVEGLSTAKAQIKRKKLIFRYAISIAIVIALFLFLEVLTNYYEEKQHNFETSEKISLGSPGTAKEEQTVQSNEMVNGSEENIGPTT